MHPVKESKSLLTLLTPSQPSTSNMTENSQVFEGKKKMAFTSEAVSSKA
jgi:hypothetical protein